MTHKPQNAAVWFEIPVRDMDAAMAFYRAVTGMDFRLEEDGPNPFAIFVTADPQAAVAGHLYPGTPAAEGQGPTVHLSCPGKLEETLERVGGAGGKVVSPVIAIPAGRFAYCQDPDGNSFGAFEFGGRLMRRADRLFRIVQHLRGGRLVTARQLGERLEVSERTIYRDIADLQGSGVPVEGEAGVGYVMRGGFELPPLMFSRDEIVALVAGARLVRAWGGAGMARAAEEALVKIEAVLPEAARARAQAVQVHAPGYELSDAVRGLIDRLERAVEAREVLVLEYVDGDGRCSGRRVRPLGLWFWGKVWTLVAWCDLRDDFRMFRLDRIDGLAPTGTRFAPDRKRSLAAFHRRREAGDCG